MNKACSPSENQQEHHGAYQRYRHRPQASKAIAEESSTGTISRYECLEDAGIIASTDFGQAAAEQEANRQQRDVKPRL